MRLFVLYKRETLLDRQDNATFSVPILLFKCLLHIHGHSSVDELITNSHNTYYMYNLVLDCKMDEDRNERDVTYSRDLVSDLWGWDMVTWIHIFTHLVSYMASWVPILTDLNIE